MNLPMLSTREVMAALFFLGDVRAFLVEDISIVATLFMVAACGQISRIVEVQLVKGNRGQERPAECIDGIRNNQLIIGVIGGRPRESRHKRWCGDVWIVRSWCIIASWVIIGAHWDVAS